MKIMYVACNAEGAEDLMIETEISELQATFLRSGGEDVHFIAFPKLAIEQLPLEIARQQPDVLHMSAHGKLGELELANSDGARVVLKAAALCAFLDYRRPPRLVYLNACHSAEVAAELKRVIPFAIGTTAPISNRTARASALLFYDRLLSGASVQNAFEAAQATMETLQSASMFISPQDDVDPRREILYGAPTIIARFADDKFTPNSNGDYELEFGLFGCPADTFQVIFFTDDESFIEEQEDDDDLGPEQHLASQLCRIVRTNPVRNTIWSEESEWVYGEYRIFASAVTGSGKVLSVASTLCGAIEAYYKHFGERAGFLAVPQEALEALQRLRSLDGSLGPGWEPRDQKIPSKLSKGRGQPKVKALNTKRKSSG